MATTNATIDVRVTGQASLDKLGTSLDGLHRRMLGLRSVVAGLGFAALGRSALQMADDLQDLSNASGIAAGNLLEFKKALETSGGQADQMATGITKFAQSIDEAAQGNQKAIYSFQQLGVSLTDLGPLSERDLLIKTLEGISKLPNASERAAAMMDKFGKTFKTVDPGELAQKLRDTAGTMDQYATTVKRADQLQDSLAKTAGTPKLAFLEAFSGPIQRINDFNKAVEDGKSKIDTLVTVLKVLTVVAATAFGFGIFRVLIGTLGTVGRGFTALKSLMQSTSAAGAISFAPNSRFMMALRGVGSLLGAIATGVATIFGLSSPDTQDTGSSKATDEKAAAEAKLKSEAEQRRKINLDNQAREIRAVQDVTAEYAKQFQVSNNRAMLEAEHTSELQSPMYLVCRLLLEKKNR